MSTKVICDVLFDNFVISNSYKSYQLMSSKVIYGIFCYYTCILLYREIILQ